jgi:hypothetical protein
MNVENPSRAWYSEYRGVGTVEKDIAVRNARAIIQKPAPCRPAPCRRGAEDVCAPAGDAVNRVREGVDRVMTVLQFHGARACLSSVSARPTIACNATSSS